MNNKIINEAKREAIMMNTTDMKRNELRDKILLWLVFIGVITFGLYGLGKLVYLIFDFDSSYLFVEVAFLSHWLTGLFALELMAVVFITVIFPLMAIGKGISEGIDDIRYKHYMKNTEHSEDDGDNA